MLLAGHSVGDAARLEGIPEHVIEATLRDASRPERSPRWCPYCRWGAETPHPAQFFRSAASPSGP